MCYPYGPCGLFVCVRYCVQRVVNTTTNINGMVLAFGSGDTQFFTCENNGTGSITFAASGTSHVKSGAATVIPPNTAMMFVYRPDQGLWYALGGIGHDVTTPGAGVSVSRRG